VSSVWHATSWPVAQAANHGSPPSADATITQVPHTAHGQHGPHALASAPAAALLVPELSTTGTVVRSPARNVVPPSMAAASPEHASAFLPHDRAHALLQRLDSLWRAAPQRALAIPQFALAPPRLG
jgi:hypothetical protein